MLARTLSIGVHSFVKLLKHQLPDLLDYLLTISYLAYWMIARLVESVLDSEETLHALSRSGFFESADIPQQMRGTGRQFENVARLPAV